MKAQQKPRIAIIGAAGIMGSRLLQRFLNAGYSVNVFDTKRVNLDVLSVGAAKLEVFNDALSAALESDVVLFAVPYKAEKDLAESIRDGLGNRIVVSISNPLTESLDDVVTPPDESAAEHLAHAMPHARIVKAFNSLSASAFDVEVPSKPVFDTFVASDDLHAAAVVEQMVRDVGFRPWYVGGLILSRTLERMSALLISVSMRYHLDGALGWWIRHVQPQQHADV